MSTQALNDPRIRSGIKDVLLNHVGLWEALRENDGMLRAADVDPAP